MNKSGVRSERIQRAKELHVYSGNQSKVSLQLVLGIGTESQDERTLNIAKIAAAQSWTFKYSRG